jgi:hypothetical protein
MPHPPQFALSKVMSVQTPPQFVLPGPQLRHVPWWQSGADAGQTFPQAPQLRGSEFTEVHVPLQQAMDVEQQA